LPIDGQHQWLYEPGTNSERAMGVDPKLLEILVCPLTKGPLRYDAEREELVSEQAGLAYPIRDGIPIMLIDEARKLDEPRAGGMAGPSQT
jgi:uncharacterized protein